ncbi:putative O-methyltransferase [Karstenula rhodostoma CBS 690.94]|uniref:O-methyltransferase n=1 Tax=Karstenula rhodostoma CBS 690.94 TaxID=1392251 RepID=A0A9P4PKJ2_9PLEO|nr:putative O-methyltransferase [Karstenula rhodostoma CBS 690.94]
MATISELTQEISSKAAELEQLLNEASLAQPSFSEHSAHDFDSRHSQNTNSEALRQARNALINATQGLTQLTMGPIDYLCSLSWSAAKVANLGSLVRLEIPRRIPLGKTRNLDDLVAEIGLPAIVTARVIRYAIANGIFYEDPVNVIGHTASSAKLASDRDLHNYCLMWSAEISSHLVKLPEALYKKQVYGPKGPESAANLAFPEFVDIFEYFEKRTDAAQRYSLYLGSRAKIPCWSADFLIGAWDWDSIGSGTVVDVGGSAGSTSVILAQAFPFLRLVSEDVAPAALKEGEAIALELQLGSRISFVQHDFFKPQKISAKVYIFKSILHDWPDATCVKIIKALLPALESGAHVLIAETLMPAEPALRTNAWDFEGRRVEDQIMIAGHAAHERTLEQFKAIFAEASDSFHFVGAKEGADGSMFSLIDFKFS